MTTRIRVRPLLSTIGAILALSLGGSLPAQTGGDTDPPVIRVLESGVDLVEGALFNRAVTPVVQTTDATQPVEVAATLDGAAFTSGTQVTGEGTHVLSVTATDAVGNAASVSLGFGVDTVPPAILEVLPAAETITPAAQVTLEGQVSGATSVTVDGQAATLVGDDFTAGPYTLAEGQRSWTIVARDAAGNTAQATHRIVRDSQPPTVSISQPAAGAVVGTAMVDVAGSASDPRLAAVTVNGIAATVTGTSWLARQVPLGEGSTTLVARAEDRAGNAAEASRQVTRDTQSPALAITDPAPGTVVPGATIAIRGTASDAHLDRVEVNGTRATLADESWSLTVPLQEGANEVSVRAVDRVGNSSQASVSVTRDSQAPAVRIEQPADAAQLNVQLVAVSGTVEQEEGLAVTVNGASATITGGTFSAAGVALVEGENRLVARVTDRLGNQGAHTRFVYRDTVAPRLLSADPASGALAVPPGSAFRLVFSEDLADPAAGSWRLETAGGQAIAAAAALDGAALTVTPAAPLPSTAQIRLVLTAGLKDPAGNALAEPPTLTFTTADSAAPGAPAISPQPPGLLCAAAVTLSGTAEALAAVRVDGGAAAAETRANEAGQFTLAVQLAPGLNRLSATALDASGNRSPAAVVEVIHDCQAPRVTGAERDGNQILIRFDERVDPATVPGAVSLAGTAVVAGTTTLSADGRTATFAPSAPPLPAGALRLEVTQAVRDLAGNPLAFPWSQVFGAGGGTSFLAGTVIDDATGRPLAGARVLVFASNGVPLPEPLPEQVTGEDGRFRLPVGAGTHDLTIVRPGYTPAFRIVAAGAGQGADVFDPRLTPAAEATAIGAAGGTVQDDDGGPKLAIPAGALATNADVAVTRLSEQGLPAILPYGWSPRGAAWVEMGGASLAATAADTTLELPVESPNGTTLVLARLDLQNLQWRAVGTAQVSGGKVSFTLSGDAGTGYAAVEADDGAVAPPAAVAGQVLGASPRPAGDEATGATLTFDPEVVLPSQASLATAIYTLSADAASGLPLTLVIEEELVLLDGSTRRQAPYQADLVLYKAPDGTPRSRFLLMPSAAARLLALELGSEDVTVRRYGGESVSGNVVGPEGGTVLDAEGDRIDLPQGAVTEASAIGLTRRAAADLPAAVPAGTALAGVVELDLGSKALLVPAALSLAMATPPAQGDAGLLLQVVDLPSGRAFRPVAALQATATGWTTATIDPADLPWPGVRDEGLYAFVRLTASIGYLRGTVFDVGGAPLGGAIITGQGLGWIQLSSADGRYVLPMPVGTTSVTADNLATGNRAAVSATVAAANERVDLDLQLQAVGPRVLEIVPADGAAEVAQGVQPTIRFSEPVDRASLAAGIQLLRDGQPVAVDLEHSGAFVRLLPKSTLLPQTAYELRVGFGVRDLQGISLTSPASATFTTKRVLLNEDLDLTKVFLVEPDATGTSQVIGQPGAVPAGTTVFIENATSFAATPSVTAGQNGSFQTTISASLTDTIILHVLIEGANEVVVELTPFLSADLRSARVDQKAATFTTGDGVTVMVPAGAFAGPVRVSVVPQPLASPAPYPADFNLVYAYRLDFGGAEAQKPIQLAIPAPAGVTRDRLLLARIWDVFGESYWMLQDLLRRDGGRFTTVPPANEQAALGAPVAVAQLASLDAPQEVVDDSGLTRFAAGARMGDLKEYLPGSANPGLYVVFEDTTFLDFVAFPFVLGQWSYYLQIGIDGCIAGINRAIERLLEHDAVLMPTRRGQPVRIEGRDLETGYKFFEGTFDPPAPDQLLVLPPDIHRDFDAPTPVLGSPIRFYVLTPAGAESKEIAPGLTMEFTPATGGQGSLEVSGEAGTVQGGVQIRLLGLENQVNHETRATEVGSFTLAASVEAGKRYLIAIGAVIGATDDLTVSFSEGLPEEVPGIEVRDAGGRDPRPIIEPLGTTETVRIEPVVGWRAGERYTLRLTPELADAAGNSWNRTLAIEFEVEASEVLDTLGLAAVRDVARLGSLLFLAADTKGLAVIDASDPTDLKHLVPGDITFPLPLNDPVHGVTVDPHGRVLVVGGGVTGFGQIKIFDPQALDPAAVAANPTDPAVLFAAFKGVSIISDRNSGVGTSLPEGTPRKVSVLSDDQTDRWRAGKDEPPAGFNVIPITAPPGGGEFTVTVEGEGWRVNRPVTLRNVTRGSWKRVDTDENGDYQVEIKAYAGDRLELVRNRDSIAYVATLGVGVISVDVNAFYNEDPANPPDPGAQSFESDVIGIYTGFEDGLELCGTPTSDVGTMVDLGVMFDPGNAHPMTIAGLVGLRGLLLLESPPVDIGEMFYFNDLCLNIEGSQQVWGLELAQDYPFDVDRDGIYSDDEYRDYLLVAHSKGVLVIDAEDREDLQLAGHVRLPGIASNVALDRERRLIFAAGGASGIYVVDFDALPSVLLRDENGDGIDDRVLEKVTLTGNTNSAPFLLPELGLAYAGGLNRGLTSVAVAAPRIAFVAENRPPTTADPDPDDVDDPRFRPIRRLAPLGVPTAPESPAEGAPDLPGAFRVLAALPGFAGDEVELDLVSLGPGGLPMREAGDPITDPDLPRTALDEDDGVVLRRMAQNPWEDGYQLYLSEEVVALADLRAGRDYVRNAEEQKEEECERCDGEELGLDPDGRDILSGHSIAVRVPEALRQQLVEIYGEDRLDQLEIAVESVPWEISPAVRQEPTQNPATGTGDVVPGTLLHSGEMTLAGSDLYVRGRGIDVAFQRTYRSQTIGSGPLGPGWDHVYRQRLRALPDGSVEYYDGRGRRELFEKKEGEEGFDAPPGRYVDLSTLERNAAGWTLLTAQRHALRFDRFGRLIAIVDAVKDAPDTGNEITFQYDLASNLTRIEDALDRAYTFEHDDEGRITKLKDFSGREVTYAYDQHGRLQSVTSPKVTVGESPFPSGLVTRYEYETPAGDLAGKLNARDNVKSVRNPRGEEWLRLTYGDEDGDSRNDEVVSQQWGTGSVSLSYGFGARVTNVTDRRGSPIEYRFNEAGQALSVKDPLGSVTSFQYDDEGNLTRQVAPLGTVTEMSYDSGGGERSRGNMTEATVRPGTGGANGSASSINTPFEYDQRTNLPTRVTDAGGTVTQVTRNRGGLPTQIRQGVGTPGSAQTTVEYNAYGQPVRTVNANGHETRLEYHESGASKGYLARTIVDPDGLALTTSYEYDERGNVTAVTDPRGVRSEFVYNELDWLVEQRLATSPAADGAPALSYVARTLYDENGNVVEERLPFDDGSAFTRVRATYGTLDEVLSVQREHAPNQFVSESYSYDPNLNLLVSTGPSGQVTQYTYDERDMVTQVAGGLPGINPPVAVTYVYDEEGRLKLHTDARGKVWTFSYDGYQRPFETTDPLGQRTRTLYDDRGNPVEVARFDAGVCLVGLARTFYDDQGRPIRVADYLWEERPQGEPQCNGLPDGAREISALFEYDRVGNVTKTVDPLGRASLGFYDAAERLIETHDAAGNVAKLHLDAAGNVRRREAREKGPDGSLTTVETEYTYDALGRRATSRDALGNTLQAVWDARGNLRLSIDPEGFLTENLYDGLSRLTKTTRPGGLTIEYGYDASSRLTSLTDALGNATAWSYDDLGRATSVTYPDSTQATFQYDGAGNPIRTVDPRGTVVVRTYDDLNRLIARQITPAAGVEGPLAESFQYDAVGRLIRAQSGSVVTDLRYDSLSRLLNETTAGRAVSYAYDDAGSRTGLRYPSSRLLGATFDPLARPSAVGIASQMPAGGQAAQITDQVASFAYRGPALLAGKTIGTGPQPAVRATMTYDPARRLIASVVKDVTTRPVLDEALAWTPRSFLQTLDRRERNGDRLTLAYDPAGRVTSASRSGESRPAIPSAFGFEYDRADNLLARTEETPFGTAEIELPLDGSGRNRPASVGGVALEWDANGNLKKKGDLTFHYDAKNRLTRVTSSQGEVASYEYDAFNRRISKTVGGVTRQTVWGGAQPLEEYVGGVLRERRTYGLGLDEIVWSERDTDGDGTLDASYHPLYDATGNLAMVVDEDGQPIEQYEYSPFGERWVVVNDRAPPAVEQVRVVGSELWLELSEEVALWKVEAAKSAGELALTATAGNASLAFTLSQPVAEGPLAGRRVKLTLAAPPAAGTEVRLVAQAGAFEDLFGNGTAAAIDQTFTWTEGVRSDGTAPAVELVAVEAGKLKVTFSEPVDAATATAILVDGQAATWTAAADGYSLVGTASLLPGAHTLAIGTGIADLAGTALAEALDRSFTLANGQNGQLVWLAPDPTLSVASTVDNLFGFHGLPVDPETGLVYVRNRYYDPELGRFISVDPLGYVDGPNPYQYALNNPYAFSDPLGLSSTLGWEDYKKFGRGLRKGLWNGAKNFVTGAYDMVTNPRETLDNLVAVAENPEQAIQGMLMSGWDFIGKLASPDPEVLGEAIGGVAGDALAGWGAGKVLSLADGLGDAAKAGRRMRRNVPDGFDLPGEGAATRAAARREPARMLLEADGEVFSVGPKRADAGPSGIDQFRKLAPEGQAGDSVGAMLRGEAPTPRIAYRALNSKDLETLAAGKGLEAKNPEGSWDLGEHLVGGSSRASWENDPWISTTTDLDVARGFNERNNFGIVAIDLDKVPAAQMRGWEVYPRRDGAEGLPYHYSIWQQEVSVYQSIPPEAIIGFVK